jgi:hypothetical protein
MFKFVAIWIYIASILAVLVIGGLVSSVLALYPAAHLSSFGPVVPTIAMSHATWLPAVQPASWAIAFVSAVTGLLIWRSRPASDAKVKAALLIASVNFFLALMFATTLLVAYFYLPKVANVA